MKTVGQLLREARVSRGIDIEQAESATKIRRKFLEAMEKDDYSPLPSISYAKGFVKNYSEFLGLNSRTVLAFFRRQTVDVPKSQLLPKGVSEPLNPTVLRLTPGRFIGLLVIGLVGVFLFYFLIQYQGIRRPPPLTIMQPQDALVTQDKRIDVLGKTDSDATVIINGVSVLVRSDGQFFDQVTLDSGVNKITITATSRFGKSTTVVRDVGLQQP